MTTKYDEFFGGVSGDHTYESNKSEYVSRLSFTI